MAASQDIYQAVTDSIIEHLDAGTIPWRKGWDATIGVPRNVRGTAYRGVNVWLLTLQAAAKGYESPYWLTFKQAKERGGHVRKGEKSTQVILWKPIKKESKDENGDPKEKSFLILRAYRVFNLDQTEDVRPPKKAEEPTAVELSQDAEAIVAGFTEGPSVKVSQDGRAYYTPARDTVSLPPREAFESSEAYYSTLFHELCHSTGHGSRLSREGIVKFDHFASHQYSAEELVAEFGATFLCAIAGISRDEEIENSAAYIAHWRTALKADPKAIIVGAARAQKAADWVLGHRAAKVAADSEKKAA